MSIESDRTRKASPCAGGEACKRRTGQPLQSAERSGGDGMSQRATEVTRETCARGAKAPTDGSTPPTEKAATARAGVGVPHSSQEAPVTGVERRRGSCAHACEAERERGDGPEGIATPTLPETATGVRKLQRTTSTKTATPIVQNGGRNRPSTRLKLRC